jgi:hypothetical protein
VHFSEARKLSEVFGADHRMIARWQIFWSEHFSQTAFWKAIRGRLVPAIQIVYLRRSLLDAYLQRGDSERRGWERLRRFLSPISIPHACCARRLPGPKPRRPIEPAALRCIIGVNDDSIGVHSGRLTQE